MKIGLTAESESDKPIEIIISRILEREDIDFIPNWTDGPIINSISSDLIKYFNLHNADLAVFCTDTDKELRKENNLRKSYKDKIERWPDKGVIFVCPEHCLESWFIKEENAIKQLLHLDSTRPLPFSNQDHKKQLEDIINKFQKDITISKLDFYDLVTKLLNLGVLEARSKDFKRFKENLKKFKRTLNN